MQSKLDRFEAICRHFSQIVIPGQPYTQVDVDVNQTRLWRIFVASDIRLLEMPDRFLAKILIEAFYQDADRMVLQDHVDPQAPLTRQYLWVSYQQRRPTWLIRLFGWVPGFECYREVTQQMFERNLVAYR